MKTNAGSVKSEGAGSADENDESEGTEQVSYDTYKRLLDQRKADRSKARELQAALDAANSEKETAEQARLAEQQRFKELYENEKKRADGLDGKLKDMTASQIDRAKRDALKSALGSVRKDDYLKFADLGSIQLNDDGSVDPESVKLVANKFRETYPELIDTKAPAKMANEAAAGFQKSAPKDPKDMSPDELRAAFRAHTQVK